MLLFYFFGSWESPPDLYACNNDSETTRLFTRLDRMYMWEASDLELIIVWDRLR